MTGVKSKTAALLLKLAGAPVFSFIILMSMAALIITHVRSFEMRNYVEGAAAGPEVIAVAVVSITTAVGSLGALQRSRTAKSAVKVLALAGIGLLVADVAGIAFGRYW